MNRARVVIKRPLLHYIISLAYILAPIANVLLLIVVARIQWTDILARLFQGYGYLAGIWLLTAPVVGIGLYFVHKASWYIFLAHSALILADYVIKWVTIPTYYWMSVAGVHQLLLFTGNIALVAIIGFIIHKDFRSPYFQVIPRGWRTSRRVLIRHYIQLNDRRCNITDLSDGGCFVAESGLVVVVGDKVDVSFQADSMPITCKGEVMRSTPDGFGVRFIALGRAQRRDIRQMIRVRFPFRYTVEFKGRWLFDGKESIALLLDISRTGCYLQAEITGIRTGDQGSLEIPFRHRRLKAAGTVIWINAEKLHGKPVGFGVRFSSSQRNMCTRILKKHKQAHPAGE